MSKENSRERIIQLAFGSYPDVEEFHFTSDNQAFIEKSDAENHASGLKDKDVESIKRGNLKKVAGKVENKGAAKDTAVAKKEAEKLRATLVEEYTALVGKKPAHNAKNETMQAAIDEVKASVAAEDVETTKHIVTQEDLDANSEFVEEGIKVGDEVDIPNE